MKKILLLMFLLTASVASFAGDEATWNEGQIEFQMSKSKQAPLIRLATFSPWSHCGIIVKKNDRYYVLEASNVVKLTPIDDWFDRGKFGIAVSYSVFDKPVKIRYKQYLGQRYDTSFKFNNGRMYCSELVYEIYLRQFGIQLCKPRKVKSYHLFGLGKVLRRRGISRNRLVVAPSDILHSKFLHHMEFIF